MDDLEEHDEREYYYNKYGYYPDVDDEGDQSQFDDDPLPDYDEGGRDADAHPSPVAQQRARGQ